MKKRLLQFSIFYFLFSITALAQYPLVTIHDLQYRSLQSLANDQDTSLYNGDTVQLEGVCTFNPCHYGLSNTNSRVGTWLEDAAGGEWSGVHVLIDSAAIGYTSGTLHQLDNDVNFTTNFQPGNKVLATGIVSTFAGNTQILLLPIQSNITGTPPMPAPHIATIDSFMQSDGLGGQTIQRVSGEKWEGVYVELDNVQVVDVTQGTGANTGRWYWSVQDGAGNKMKIRDVSGVFRNDVHDIFCTASGATPANFDLTPYINAQISFLKGMIVENLVGGHQEYYIAPLQLSDLGTITAAPPIISQVHPLIGNPTTSQAQTISAKITDADGTIASATLYYSTGLGNQTFTSAAMTQGSGNIWTGNIPATGPDSTYVNYWIKAFDNQANRTDYPDSLATHSFYLVLNSGINSISDLQWNPILNYGPSMYAGDTITQNMSVDGIVMSTMSFYDLGMVNIQSSANPYCGIQVKGATGNGVDTLKRGDKIRITGAVVNENFGITQLQFPVFTVLNRNNALFSPVMTLPIDSIRMGRFAYTEPYESMLIGYDTVFVVNQNPDAPSNFGEWSIKKDTIGSIGLRCDDYSNDMGPTFNIDSLSIDEQLNYCYGILTYGFGNWKMMPRNKDDIEGFHTNIPNGIIISCCLQCGENLIFPNPTSGILNILSVTTEGTNRTGTMNIHDLTGRILLTQFIDTRAMIDISQFVPGIYILEFKSNDGTFVSKIVKE